MKFSIYSIVKNEEAEIEAMLETIKGADEIIVCDTGSTDRTIEILKQHPEVKLYTDYTWNDDFAEAKNYAASKCTGDWLMSLDADCRLEPGFFQKVKQMIENTKYDALYVELESIQFPGSTHKRAKIYKNNGKIHYEGMAHEDLNVFGYDHESGFMPKIYYGYSINHKKDPGRYLRILTKQVDKNPTSPRYQFYLAREYMYKKDYGTAINLFREYLKISKYEKERVEALLHMAECYWWTKQGGKAREACIQALLSNPDHKRVLTFMSQIYNEPWKSKWKHIANNATNKDVMFIR
jgi:glycosyltransferase involved in cell wall biosynthesis